MILKGLYFFNYINSNSYVDIYSNNIQVPIDMIFYHIYSIVPFS